MSKKPEVSPDQGMLLAPPTRAFGATALEMDGGVYYQRSETFLSLEEQEKASRLKAEASALKSLGNEYKSLAAVTHYDNILRDVNWEYFEKPDNVEEYIAGINNKRASAQESLLGLRLATKGHFAGSLGIAVHTENTPRLDGSGEVVRDDAGLVVNKHLIRADDSSRQEELDAKYRVFRMTFEGKDGKGPRERRIKVIEEELEKTLK